MTKPPPRLPDRLTLALLFLISAVGFADAVYLTAKFYAGVVPPCSLVEGCETVTTSQYATILGVPVSLLGVLFYFTLIIFLIAYFDGRRVFFLKAATVLAAAGFAFSLWLLFVQLFIIGAVCLYCLGSFVTATLFFSLSAAVVGWGRYDRIKGRMEDGC